MTAGAVAVPTIVPLRAPIPGQHKTLIDSNTKIELRSGKNYIFEFKHIVVLYNCLIFLFQNELL